MKNGKLNKAEQIMQNYRKAVKEIDSQYENIEENNNKYETSIKELNEKIAYEKNFIEKLKDGKHEEDLGLIDRAKERLEKALAEKQDIEKNHAEEKTNNIEEIKKSKVVLPSGREVTRAEKDEIDKNHLKDEARRALTQESKRISKELEEKNKKLLANRAARAEFKYEYEKDKDGKSTGKIINADVLVQNHKDFEKITEEMAELSKEQESCTKYLEEFRQMDNKKMEEFAKAWNEAARDDKKLENSKSTPSDQTQGTTTSSNPTQGTTTPNDPTQGTTTPNNPTQGTTTPNDPIQGTTTPNDPTQGTTTPNDPIQGTTTPNDPTQGTTTPNKQKIKIVIGRRLNIETDKYIIGIGKTGKLIKQDREDISAKLQKILKGKSIEELKDREEISETIDPILLEGIIELKNKNMITEMQMNKILLKLAGNDAKKEDLNFEIVYDMKDLSKGAFLPWNRKTRDQIAKIAEENREKGIAEFKDGKEYEPNPIKRMLESVKQRRLGKGEERETIDVEFKEVKDENAKKKSRFTNPFKNRIKEKAKTKSVYEQLRDDSFKSTNLDEVIKRAKEAAINGKITKTQLVGIINNVKATQEREERAQSELGKNVSKIMEEETK